MDMATIEQTRPILCAGCEAGIRGKIVRVVAPDFSVTWWHPDCYARASHYEHTADHVSRLTD
jgi:hypothetical protein